MTGIKDLFRRKSRGKSISGERPDFSEAPPSPSRSSQPANSPRNAATNTTQNGSNADVRSTTPNPRATRSSMPQDPSSLIGGSAPYDAMPSGRTPDKGAYPLHGNGGANVQNDVIPSQNRSRAGSGSNSARQPSGSQTPVRGSAQQVGQLGTPRSQSQASQYTDASRYSQDAMVPRYNEDIPPVPQTPQVNSTINSRQTARIVSQPPLATGNYGYNSNNNNNNNSNINNTPRSTRDPSHRRDVSSASVGSGQKTPIADEFSSSAWYKQRGSTSIPEFSEAHPRNTSLQQSPTTSGIATRTDAQNIGSGISPIRVSGQYNPASGGLHKSTAVMDRSAALGRAIENNDDQLRQTNVPEQQFDDSLGAAYGDASSGNRVRQISIPRRGLDKPLPVPVEASAPATSGGFNKSNLQQQTLPIRENGKAMPDRSGANLAQTNGQYKALDEPVTPRQQTVQPAVSPDSPSSPRMSGKYTRTAPQTSGITDIRSGPQQIYQRPYVVEGSANPPTLHGIVNLKNSVDTSTHVRYAKPIIHETVLPAVHHIREERITREIHNYHVHHRILPIIDVQVLPTKHVVRSSNAADGEYIEIPEHLVPGREHRNWVIAETVSKIAGQHAPAQGPRPFTARTFQATEGDYKEYINEQGVPTTETWWVHPPTIAAGAYMDGQTLPLYFD